MKRVQARAAQNDQTLAIPTKEGYSVSVSFSTGVPVNQELAQSYVAFLDALPHGPELGKLSMSSPTRARSRRSAAATRATASSPATAPAGCR